MDAGRQKYVAREFIRRLTALSENQLAFKEALHEFALSSPDVRTEVVTGLLTIGEDYSEPAFHRGFAFCVLSMIVRTCGLLQDEELEERLCSMLVRPTLERQISSASADGAAAAERQQILKGALLALIAVNRPLGLARLDHLIERHSGSDFARQLRELRLNASP